ncbi:MAG: PAS domain S-box protein [Planctomycetes bacterium]|nr:PAS domain S-box protein [Planctomycetota bacterium]
MESVRLWFEMNLNLVFFVYGLSFLVMGTAILIQPKKGSQFKFAGILWLLVAYALLHMLSDSYSVLTFGDAKREAAAHTTHIVTYAAYLCFFEFGRRLVGLSRKTFFAWILPVISIGVVTASVLSGSFWTHLDVMVGYFVRFPAGIMAGLGIIWYYYSEKEKLEPLGVRKFFISAGIAFLLWAFFCGIIREKADFFPANLLNMESFAKTVYIPVYVFRAVCAVVVTISILKILSVFEWESLRQLQEEMEKEYRAREKYKTVIETVMDGFFIAGPDGSFLDVNDAYCGMTGYSREELLRMRIQDVEALESPEDTARHMKKMMKTGSDRFESKHRAKDGSVMDIEASVNFFQNDGNSFFVFLRDITGRKQAEKLLRRNEEYFRTVVEASLDAVVAVDEQGRIMLFNYSAEKLFGYSSGEMIGMPASILMKDDKKEAHQRNLEKFMKEGIGQCAHIGRRLEQVFRRKDGTFFEAEVAMAGGRSDKYRIIVISIHDITNRKRAEQLVRESEAKYRTIFETTGTATVIIESDTVISLANTEFEKLSGFARSQIEGQKSLMEFVSDEDKETIKKHHDMRREDADSAPRNYEFRFVGKDGAGRDVFITVAMIPGTQKSVASLTDITDRRKLETQFMQAQKMEVVGRLAGGIAHDFNNLLTVILGNTTLLLGQLKQDGSDYEMAKVIREASERGAQLTKQLLAFSRRQIIEPVILNINDVTLKMSKMLTRVLGEDIECKFAFKPDLKLIKADVGQMGQVIMNLAVNAREAMPKGGRFSISTDNIMLDERYCDANADIKPGEYVRLSITDTGIGMTGEVRAHLFEPFFTTKQSGTGLGLATVYGIVKQSGGCISVYSEIGQGTTFHIYLPVAAYSDAGDTTKVHKQKEETMPEGKETVLVVEDELRLRELVVIILESLGYAVLSASGMEEAFGKAEACKGRIDLLLSDVILPGRSGVEVAQELKKKFQDIKVIFMSGYTDDRIEQSGFDTGKINFLQKPFTPSDLAHKVRDVLNKTEK